MTIGITQEALGIAHSVGKLRPEDQQRVLRLVDLMLVAPAEARVRAQTMIRDTLTEGSDAHERCVAKVDATIRYLEVHAAPAGPF